MTIRPFLGPAAAYLAATVVERVAAVAMLPLMTRSLTPADYGVILLVTNIGAALNLLSGFTLAQALAPLLANADGDARRRDVTTSVLAGIFAVTCCLHLACALVATSISRFQLGTDARGGAIAFGLLSSALAAMVLASVQVVRLLGEARLYLRVQLSALALQIALVVAGVILGGLGLAGYYAALSAGAALALALYAVGLRRWLSGRLDGAILHEALMIGAQMLPWQGAVLLVTGSAGVLLTRAGRIEEAGLYAVALGATGILVAVAGSFEAAWTAHVLSRKDDPALPDVQLRVFACYSSGMLMLTAGTAVFSRELFLALAGPSFQAGHRLLPPLVLAYAAFCFATAFAQGMQARRRMGAYGRAGFAAALVFLLTGPWAAPAFGAGGLIPAIDLSFLVMLVVLQLGSARLMPVAYPWRRHAVMWALAIAVVAPVSGIESDWTAVAIKLAAMAVVAALPFLCAILRPSDIASAGAALWKRSPPPT